MKATTISPGIYTVNFDGWEISKPIEPQFDGVIVTAIIADGHEG